MLSLLSLPYTTLVYKPDIYAYIGVVLTKKSGRDNYCSFVGIIKLCEDITIALPPLVNSPTVPELVNT
jgi:hypothetical protein